MFIISVILVDDMDEYRMCQSHHPNHKLVDVVWVTELVDQRKQHTTCQHLLKQ